MTITPDQLRQIMRLWATGVTLVTSFEHELIHGMTVSSFTSISIKPPRILVALKQTTRTHRMVEASGYFAVAILAQDQEEISDIFAGRVGDEENRFEGIDVIRSPSGCPIPEGSLGYLDCRVESTIPVATHSIVIGDVLETARLRQVPPLLYYDQGYRGLAGI